jgi:hypothetical protein
MANPEYIYCAARFLACRIDTPPDMHRSCVQEMREYEIGTGEIKRIFKCPCPCGHDDDEKEH